MRQVLKECNLCACGLLLCATTAASFGAGVKLESFADSEGR